jgi:parallel beta helix pectate lyase-like protein
MNRHKQVLIVAVVAISFLSTDWVHGAQRTFVSAGSGSDANPCTRAFPCRNFATAVGVTDAGGEVVVLDSGGYGTVSITQEVALISPQGVYAGITAMAGIGIAINAAVADKVVLRGLTVNGIGGTNGVYFGTGNSLTIESCVINGFNDEGIASVAADGTLSIKDTIARNNGSGILIAPVSGLSDVSVEHCRVEGNVGDGVWAGSNTHVSVRDSVIFDNAVGIRAQNAGSTAVADVSVENCAILSNSSIGLFASGAGQGFGVMSVSNSSVAYNATGIRADTAGIIRVSNCTITRNTTGVTALGGAIITRLNNTLEANTPDGAFTATFAAK